MWYAGIDWADEKHNVLIIDEAGHQIGKRQVKHTVEGLAELTHLSAIHQWPREESRAGLYRRNQPWLADRSLAGSRICGLSGQSQND